MATGVNNGVNLPGQGSPLSTLTDTAVILQRLDMQKEFSGVKESIQTIEQWMHAKDNSDSETNTKYEGTWRGLSENNKT